jgi:hypothetical protein
MGWLRPDTSAKGPHTPPAHAPPWQFAASVAVSTQAAPQIVAHPPEPVEVAVLLVVDVLMLVDALLLLEDVLPDVAPAVPPAPVPGGSGSCPHAASPSATVAEATAERIGEVRG